MEITRFLVHEKLNKYNNNILNRGQPSENSSKNDLVMKVKQIVLL